MSRAARAFGETGLADLCESAAKRNAAMGVTGLILYDGIGFIQALEGDRSAVEDIMHDIAGDVRHHDITYLADSAITIRQFGILPMRVHCAHHGQTMRNFLLEVKADVNAVEDLTLQATFIGFAALAANRTGSRNGMA
jgi:hypothetical protein